MGFGGLRNLLRPIAKSAIDLCSSRVPASRGFYSVRSFTVFPDALPKPESCIKKPMWFCRTLGFHSLTDTRFPKRRPGFSSRRKRASMKPPGPYAWVQYVPGEPIPSSRPNEGSIKAKGRNRIKRIKQRKAFIKSEAKKRKAEMSEAKRKTRMERIERKMAAVARERAWAQRLIELQQLEEAKKNSAEAS